MEDDMHALTSDQPSKMLRFGFSDTRFGTALMATSGQGVA